MCTSRVALVPIAPRGPASLPSPAAVLEILRPWKEAASKAKVAIIVVRHDRKSGGEVGQAGRGSTAFSGAVDQLIRLRRPEGNSRDSLRVMTCSGRAQMPDELVVDRHSDGTYVALGNSMEDVGERRRCPVIPRLEEAIALYAEEQGTSAEVIRLLIESMLEIRDPLNPSKAANDPEKLAEHMLDPDPAKRRTFYQTLRKRSGDQLVREADLDAKLNQVAQDKSFAAWSIAVALDQAAANTGFRDRFKAMRSVSDIPRIVCPVVPTLLPVAKGSLVLLGGAQESGKSTVTGNLAEPLVTRELNVLVISNEEPEDHVRLRVASLTMGIPFVRCLPTAEIPLTDAEHERVAATVERQQAHLQVVGLGTGKPGTTTTPRGIAGILDRVAKGARRLDLIILDYITKIEPSGGKQEKRLAILEVMSKLDTFKNACGIPVVVLTQVRPSTGKLDEPFSSRTKECHSLCDLATHAVEIRKDREFLMTVWKRHDWRWDDGRDDTAITKWEAGRLRDPRPDELHAYLEAMRSRKAKRGGDPAALARILDEGALGGS